MKDFIGETTLVNFTVARGKNVQDGKVVFTLLSEYDPNDYDTEFFYYNENDEMIDEKGNVVDRTQFDRASFSPNTIYMRLKGKGTSLKEHTVQVFNDNEASPISQAEFLKYS